MKRSVRSTEKKKKDKEEKEEEEEEEEEEKNKEKEEEKKEEKEEKEEEVEGERVGMLGAVTEQSESELQAHVSRGSSEYVPMGCMVFVFLRAVGRC